MLPKNIYHQKINTRYLETEVLKTVQDLYTENYENTAKRN